MIDLITYRAELFWVQILHNSGVKAFVGGNLGKPLSEASIACLKASSVEDIYQVAIVCFNSVYQLFGQRFKDENAPSDLLIWS